MNKQVDPIARQVAEKLKTLRQAASMSLEDLSAKSGVSRATLSQIETKKTNPTIAVLWKIAQGLGVPFSELLGSPVASPTRLSRADDARYLESADGRFRSRPLLNQVPGHRVEQYELHLAQGAHEQAAPHPPGSFEQIYVIKGALVLNVNGETFELGPADALLFHADVSHSYTCTGAESFVGTSLILYT